MKRRLLTHGIVVALLLTLAAAPVDAGDETCFPIEVDWFSPSGVAGCSLDGPTEGVASVYGGEFAAANWCVYPWMSCGSVRVQSHQTGVVITIPVRMYCDCFWFSDRRLVDLTLGQVEALGLNPEAGIFRVTVTPFREGIAPVRLPDTAAKRYNGCVGYEPSTLESRTVGRGCSYHLRPAVSFVRGMSS